jgi:hypothetical protein
MLPHSLRTSGEILVPLMEGPHTTDGSVSSGEPLPQLSIKSTPIVRESPMLRFKFRRRHSVLSPRQTLEREDGGS